MTSVAGQGYEAKRRRKRRSPPLIGRRSLSQTRDIGLSVFVCIYHVIFERRNPGTFVVLVHQVERLPCNHATRTGSSTHFHPKEAHSEPASRRFAVLFERGLGVAQRLAKQRAKTFIQKDPLVQPIPIGQA